MRKNFTVALSAVVLVVFAATAGAQAPVWIPDGPPILLETMQFAEMSPDMLCEDFDRAPAGPVGPGALSGISASSVSIFGTATYTGDTASSGLIGNSLGADVDGNLAIIEPYFGMGSLAFGEGFQMLTSAGEMCVRFVDKSGNARIETIDSNGDVIAGLVTGTTASTVPTGYYRCFRSHTAHMVGWRILSEGGSTDGWGIDNVCLAQLQGPPPRSACCIGCLDETIQSACANFVIQQDCLDAGACPAEEGKYDCITDTTVDGAVTAMSYASMDTPLALPWVGSSALPSATSTITVPDAGPMDPRLFDTVTDVNVTVDLEATLFTESFFAAASTTGRAGYYDEVYLDRNGVRAQLVDAFDCIYHDRYIATFDDGVFPPNDFDNGCVDGVSPGLGSTWTGTHLVFQGAGPLPRNLAKYTNAPAAGDWTLEVEREVNDFSTGGSFFQTQTYSGTLNSWSLDIETTTTRRSFNCTDDPEANVSCAGTPGGPGSFLKPGGAATRLRGGR